jgi:hypothetical protein
MRRNMSIHELQARRQQRFTFWAMVAMALLAAPLLTGCGGGDPCEGMSDRDAAKCYGIPDAQNAFSQPCTAPMNSAMWGFWARVEECGIPRGSLIPLGIPGENL